MKPCCHNPDIRCYEASNGRFGAHCATCNTRIPEALVPKDLMKEVKEMRAAWEASQSLDVVIATEILSDADHSTILWGNRPEVCEKRKFHDYDEVELQGLIHRTCIDCGFVAPSRTKYPKGHPMYEASLYGQTNH